MKLKIDFVFLKWAITDLFFSIFVLVFEYSWEWIRFADDWIWTADLWGRKQPNIMLDEFLVWSTTLCNLLDFGQLFKAFGNN